jgi:hypothetical protein
MSITRGFTSVDFESSTTSSLSPTSSPSSSSSYDLGSGDTSGIADDNLSKNVGSDLLMSGSIAGVLGLLFTLAILLFIVRRNKSLQSLHLTKNEYNTRPLPPSSRPPNHARHDFETTSRMITNPLLQLNKKKNLNR